MESGWVFSVPSLDRLRNCRVGLAGTFSLTTGFAGPCRTCFSEAVPCKKKTTLYFEFEVMAVTQLLEGTEITFCLAKVLPGFWTGALLSLARSPALFDPAALLPRSPITVRVLRPMVVALPENIENNMKMMFLGVPLCFPPKKGVQFSANSIQLNLPV